MALDEIKVKKGSTFSMECTVRDGDVPLNLTGWTIKSALKHGVRVLGLFTVTPLNLSTGQFKLSGLATSSWPAETLQVDIKYTSPSDIVSYTETFYIVCSASITP